MLAHTLDHWRFWIHIRGMILGGAVAKVAPRLPRHQVHRPLVYRRQSGLIWYNGTTENYSCSGLLFRGEKFVSVGNVIEASFEQPLGERIQDEMPDYCWAKVVRTLLPPGEDRRPAFAVRILRRRSVLNPAPDVRSKIGDARQTLSRD